MPTKWKAPDGGGLPSEAQGVRLEKTQNKHGVQGPLAQAQIPEIVKARCPYCRTCGTHVPVITSPRCPECDTPLRLGRHLSAFLEAIGARFAQYVPQAI